MISEMYVRLICEEIQAFSSNDILEMIDPDDLEKIKQKDPHPYFKAFVLAHEGISSPRFVGDTLNTEIIWPAKAIQSMKNFIKKGIKFFKGHNKDNSISNREALGKIVATKEMIIKNKLSNVVVGYFPSDKKEEIKKMNICSMEALWNFIKRGGKIIADSLKELTGVALGNSINKKPAFEGARELGFVQAFENIKGEQEMEITFNDVETFVKQRNVYPSQLYSFEQIKADRVFIPEFNEIESREKDLKQKLETSEKEKESAIKGKEKSDLSLLKFTSKDKISEIIKKATEGKSSDYKNKFEKFVLKKSESWDKFDDESIIKNITLIQNDLNELMAGIDDKTPLPKDDKNKNDDKEYPENKSENNPALNYDV